MAVQSNTLRPKRFNRLENVDCLQKTLNVGTLKNKVYRNIKA